LSTFFRALAFLVAVCCLTWVGVLWWWQRTGHSAEVSDLVLYLGVLPLAVALALLGLRWAWQRAAAGGAAAGVAASGGATPASAGGADAAKSAEAQARHAVVQLVLAQAHSVAGDQAGDVLEAAAAGKPLPRPDDDLSNDDGLPVLCARMADQLLDVETVRAELDDLLPAVRQQAADGPAHEPGEQVLRALAALKPLLVAQRDWLLALHQTQRNALEDGGASIDRLPPAQRPPLPGLRVLLGWPVHWSAFDQALARAWAERCLQDEQRRLAAGYAVAVTSLAGSGEELWLRADQMSHGAGRSPWLLVAACDSDLTAERVDALASAQRLYDATTRPGGCIPGEAAAALLLAPSDWVPPADLEVATVRLHRPALLRRDKPIEAPGRVGHLQLAQALEQALAAAQVAAADLGMLVCDADLHSQRSTELYGMAVDALQHLDPVEDMRLLGKVTGHTGAASALLVLAAAAEAVRVVKKPTLALGVADSHLRMALVLQPPQASDDTAA
jgi:hypothetical protein